MLPPPTATATMLEVSLVIPHALDADVALNSKLQEGKHITKLNSPEMTGMRAFHRLCCVWKEQTSCHSLQTTSTSLCQP